MHGVTTVSTRGCATIRIGTRIARSRRVRLSLIVIGIVTIACVGLRLAAAPSSNITSAASEVRVFASAEDKSITEGETIVDGSPDVVYAAMLDYGRWPKIFDDVARVEVTRRSADDARVTLVGTDGHRDNLHFRNQPAARMVWFEDTGNSHAEVWAEIVFAPGQAPATTRVHTRLYAETRGIASLVVGGGEVRRTRERKVEHDLASIRSYFRRR
jgi:hypothetical protein